MSCTHKITNPLESALMTKSMAFKSAHAQARVTKFIYGSYRAAFAAALVDMNRERLVLPGGTGAFGFPQR